MTGGKRPRGEVRGESAGGKTPGGGEPPDTVYTIAYEGPRHIYGDVCGGGGGGVSRVLSLSGGFTPYRHLRPSSWRKHRPTVV